MGARGFAHVEIVFSGQPHHAGRPDNSRNPIAGTAQFLQRVLAEKLPESARLGAATVTAIECESQGQRPRTPDQARILLDRRLVLEDPSLEDLLEKYLSMASAGNGGLEVAGAIRRHQFPYELNPEEPIVAALAESLRLVKGEEPVYYTMPVNGSPAGYLKYVQDIPSVAFAGTNHADMDKQEHLVLSQGVTAAQALVGAVLLYGAS
jgi:acetylornithine deacetylase/succinyl-diaminopimelate desuccinylase-like protein